MDVNVENSAVREEVRRYKRYYLDGCRSHDFYSTYNNVRENPFR